MFVFDNCSYFKVNGNVHNFNTRQRDKYHPQPLNLRITDYDPVNMGIKIGNHMPQHFNFTDKEKRQSFKQNVKELLLKHSFYNMDEFFRCTFN